MSVLSASTTLRRKQRLAALAWQNGTHPA